MIKEPHAEETVTGIQVTRLSVSKRIKVVAGRARQGRAEHLLSVTVIIENVYREINVQKLELVCQ